MLLASLLIGLKIDKFISVLLHQLSSETCSNFKWLEIAPSITDNSPVIFALLLEILMITKINKKGVTNAYVNLMIAGQGPSFLSNLL